MFGTTTETMKRPREEEQEGDAGPTGQKRGGGGAYAEHERREHQDLETTLNELREKVRARGANGILGLGRLFRVSQPV